MCNPTLAYLRIVLTYSTAVYTLRHPGPLRFSSQWQSMRNLASSSSLETELMLWRELEPKERRSGDKRRNLESASCTLAKCADKAQRTTFKDTLERNLKFRDHLRMRRTSCSIKARQAILYHHAARDDFNLALNYKYLEELRKQFTQNGFPLPL